MRIFLSLCITASLLMLGNNVARSTDVELTGWPYQVDVVRENLGRFTSQSGLSATFNPFPSNEYHTKMVASFTSGTNFDVVYVRFLHHGEELPSVGRQRLNIAALTLGVQGVECQGAFT